MNGIVVDTSVWIDYFNGDSFPTVDNALKEGAVLLSPVVLAELLSAKLNTSARKQFLSFLEELKFIECGFSHWVRVGELRYLFARKGITISTPDAHIAQVCIDEGCSLISRDKIFLQMSKVVKLKLVK